MWDAKYEKLEDLLNYIETYEKFKYFELSESAKNNDDFDIEIINEVLPINLMNPETISKGRNRDSILEFKVNEKFKDYLKREKEHFLSLKKYLIKEKEHIFFINKINKKLSELLCTELCVEQLGKIFASCSEEYIFEVIKIVDSWYANEDWFNYLDNNKLLYYGATLYYSILNNGNIGLDFDNYDLKIKEKLENTYFKCIAPIKVPYEFEELF